MALLYGYADSVDLLERSLSKRQRTSTKYRASCCYWWASALLLVGLLFKGSASRRSTCWTPDVYQGAPTPVTAFMAACTKVAAFGAILRVLYGRVHRPDRPTSWRPVAVGARRSRRWSIGAHVRA